MAFVYFCFWFHSWSNIFDDKESGLDYFLWSVGSMPGYNDMMEFKKVNDVCATNGPSTLTMEEGHAYYINVRVSIGDIHPKYIMFSIKVSCCVNLGQFVHRLITKLVSPLPWRHGPLLWRLRHQLLVTSLMATNHKPQVRTIWIFKHI